LIVQTIVFRFLFQQLIVSSFVH